MPYTANLTPIQSSAISEDEKTRVLAEMREKAHADYESAMANQREEGRQEGRQEGEIIGIEKIITAMLRNGKTPEQIASDTEIPIENVRKIQEQAFIR